MSEKILAIKDHDGLCWNCLKTVDKKSIHKIVITSLGYESVFDNWSTEIHLCDDCYNQSIEKIPDLWLLEEYESDIINHLTRYKYEDEILDYFHRLPLQGQQFVYNEFSHDSCFSVSMEPQDWIGYELGILSHEKCKEYCMYSPDEKKAYKERFPKCQYPTNIIYDDNSKGCWCPFGANGKYGQSIEDCQTSDECYQCEYYKKRTTPIKDIRNCEKSEYFEYVRMTLRADYLKKKFEDT